ncbi:hypothetical protein ACFLZ2_00315 [Candidatus Margulisiibacteriota bacterium]
MFIILLLFSLSCCPAFSEIDLGGYYKSDLIYIQNRSVGSPINNMNKLRLKFDYQPDDRTLFHIEPQMVAMSGFSDFPIEGASDLDKLSWERAYLSLNYGTFDLIGGKQRIAWGTGRVWNPTDIFNPFSLTLADEEKQGVDALRVINYLGAASNIDAVVLSATSEAQRKWALKTKTNYLNYDLSVSYINMGEGQGYMIGSDFAGEMWDFEVRGEFAGYTPGSGEAYLNFCLGGGYTLDNGLGIDIEYYNNGLGKSDKSDYNFNALFSGEATFLARHYLSCSTSYMINELETIRGAVIWNLVDGGLLLYPSYSYNLFEDVDLSFDAILYSAASGDEWNPGLVVDPTGFIGSNLYFVRVRYSF